MKNEFIPYEQALALKGLGFGEPCYGWFDTGYLRFGCYESECVTGSEDLPAPLYQQAINFLYICSDKQIDIELKGGDTHEERIRKIEQGCKDLWNLQNNKSK
jgi:hypothetical protein